MAQFFILLIFSFLFTLTTQTSPAAEGADISCPLNDKDIGQIIEQKEKEIKVPKDLFKGGPQGKFGWHKKVVEFIKEKLDKWLWSWASRSEAVRAKFNEMMQKSLDKIALLAAEGLSVRHAIVPFVDRMKEYLFTMDSEMDKFWVDKLRHSTGDSTSSEPTNKPTTNVQENPNDDNKDGENEAEFGAREHTELLNYNFGSMEDLIGKIKSGEIDKEMAVEGGKPQQKRMSFADSTIGQHLHALRTKVLTMLKAFLARTKAGNLIAAFANLPGILHKQQNSSPWAWMAKCARIIRGGHGHAETIDEDTNKQLAEEKPKYASPVAGFGDFASSSAAVDLPRRVKRAKRRYYITVGGSNPPVFGHQYSHGVSRLIGFCYYVGWFIYGAAMYIITNNIWESSDYIHFRDGMFNGPPYWCGPRQGCARPYAVAFGVFGSFSSLFLLFLPFLNIY